MNKLEQRFAQEVVPLYDAKQMEAQLPSELCPQESSIPTSDEEIKRWEAEHGQ